MKKIFILIGILLIMTGCTNTYNKAGKYSTVNYNNQNNVKKEVKSVISDNIQTVTIDVNPSSYQDIVVQKGIPVKFVLNITEENLNGCNNAIKISEFNINKDLQVGENIVEFTPNESGVFSYTCWMNMIVNKIIVVEDINNTQK